MGVFDQPADQTSDGNRFHSPGSTLSAARIFVAIAGICAAISCFAVNLFYVASGVLAWIGAAIAVILSIVALVRNSKGHKSQEACLPHKRFWKWLSITTLLFGLQSAACVRMNYMFILFDWSFVSGANLRGIYAATVQYNEDFKEPAESLWTLLDEGLIADLQMVAPGETGARIKLRQSTRADFSPSYILRSNEVESGLSEVLAYEREPWSVRDFRMRPTHVHAVIGSDGRVQYLTPEELAVELNARR